MRDAIVVENRGVPTVLLLTGGLMGIASETARVACMPDLPIVPVERPLHGLEREEIAAAARPLGRAVLDALMCG